jgi:uncharacterized protein YyaL (SSP411 family)
MAEGGIYDQLGGGFHRYSTDAKWLVPHFEKMLYDNALLSRLYLHYYQITHDEFARNVVEGILDYVAREMTGREGGFYSTQDADSEGQEGKFFVWTVEEVEQVLGKEDASLFLAYYNVTPEGNFEGKNILHVTRSLEAVAESEGVSIDSLRSSLNQGREKLFAVRERRVKPGRDEKILTAWNGLMLASFAEAAAILEREDYQQIATRNAQFMLEHLRCDGLLLRTYKEGKAKLNGYLEDYANFIDGLLALYEATGELRWFQEALSLARKMIEEFWDEEDGGFYFTGKSHEALIVRSKDYFDNATPSGNSVAADVLLRLAVLTDNEELRRRALTVLRLVAESIRRFPSAFGRSLCALDFYLSSPKEIVILGDSASPDTKSLKREIWKNYLPNKVIAQASPEESQTVEAIALLRGRTVIDNRPTAFVCEHYACNQPVTRPDELAVQLSQGTPGRPTSTGSQPAVA